MDNTLLLVIIIYLIFSINHNRIRQLRTTADKRKIKDFRKIACRHLVARRYTALRKYASYLYAPIYSKVRRRKMSEKLQLKGGISEPNFGYNAKTVVYTTLMSDIHKLYEMLARLL